MDNFSKQICEICFRELESAFNFRTKCQNIDNKLRSLKSDSVKIEIKIKDDGIPLQNYSNNEAVEEKMDSFQLQDSEVFDNDDSSMNNDVDMFREESKEKVQAVKNKVVKKVRTKPRKLYDYSRVCEVCGKRTRNIKNHMDSHATEKCYTCEQCGKKFKFKSGLVIHKAVHNPVPKKTCEVCGKTFHVIAQYRKHFVYHVNERKFSCETCGKAFHTKEILMVHTRMHTDERPFNCPDCGKTFRTAGCVSRHRRIVHKKHPNTLSRN